MRLHRLRLAAFGPFADSVDLNLDDLSAAGLFLIHGPTGAGKTSLLDAICYALFANVPGARGRKALVSDHAQPGIEPFVELEFTVGGERLRVWRSPEWYRPKRRGEGTTREQAKVRLEVLHAGSWQPLSARNDEVAEKLDDLVGLGLAQFAKVVLLPQGDFAAFLRASADERGALLEKLFDIRRFADVEAWLVDARREANASHEQIQRDLESSLDRLVDLLAERDEDPETECAPAADASGSPEQDDAHPGRDWRGLSASELVEALAELGTALAAAETQALTELERAEHLAVAASEKHAAAERQLSAAQRGESASAVIETLAQRRQWRQESGAAVERAERAVGITGHYSAHERAAMAARAHTDDVSALTASLAALLPGQSLLESFPSLTPGEARGDRHALTAMADHVRTLDPLIRDATRRRRDLALRQGELHRAAQERSAVVSARDKAASAIAPAREQLQELDSELAELGPLAAERPALQARADQAARLLEAARQRDLLGSELTQALQAERDTTDAWLEAREALADLRQQRLDQMSGELAQSLQAGEHCPVCGALEHPQPAPAPHSPVTPETQRAAEDVVRRRAGDREGAMSRVTKLKTSIEHLEQQLAGASLEDVSAEHQAAELALSRATEASTRHEQAKALHQRLRSQIDAVERAAAQQDQQLATLDGLIAALTGNCERDIAAVNAAVGEHHSCPCVCDPQDPAASPDAEVLDPLEAIEAVAHHHTQVSDLLTQLTHAVDASASAQEALAQAAAAVDAALQEAGFRDVEEALACALPRAELIQTRDEITAYDQGLHTAEATLADPDVAAAMAQPAPDLAATRLAAEEAHNALVAASARRRGAADVARAFNRLHPTLREQADALGPASEQAARIRLLADTVSGSGSDNVLRMRLTSFVLASRLEKVVELANERLSVLDGGRYVLEHTDERVSGRQRSGLGLRVLDSWTGEARDTSTLSGGESFMASLALALGLADAVTESAGGHDFGTLFIDEGFGSLDDGSLEEVLAVLDGLRSGGRAVGVVSHVSDLRDRIPSQLVVEKTSSGSNVRVITDTDQGSGAA